MNIHRSRRELENTKEMKLSLSLRHHLQLHKVKVITGKSMSAVVGEALDRYFDEMLEEAQEPSDHI